MKGFASLGLAMAAVLMATTAPALAVRTFMHADGVPGPVNKDGKPGWFEVRNFKWGSPAKPAPGNRPPRSGPGAFSFTKQNDSATTRLMQLCVNGTPIPKATIGFEHSPGKKLQKYIVINIDMTVCPELEMPAPETYQMHFSGIKWEFTESQKDKKPDDWKPGK